MVNGRVTNPAPIAFWQFTVSYPAKAAGIQKHDILLAIEDTEILDGAQLKNYLIERTTPGQEVSVKVRRIDADLIFHVILGGG